MGASREVETAREFGADRVSTSRRRIQLVEAERFAPAGYGVVCDANGGATLQDSYDHLRRAGKLVVYGFHTMMPKRGGTDWLAELMFDFTRWLKSGEIVPLRFHTVAQTRRDRAASISHGGSNQARSCRPRSRSIQ